jgi:hypothetical protein
MMVTSNRKEQRMKAGPDLVERWRRDPRSKVAVIVHVRDAPVQYVEGLRKAGLSVTRMFRLTKTIAAQGLAGDVLDLLDMPWVEKVELDQTITIQGRA